MAIPVEPDGPGWKIIAIGALSLLNLIFGWIANATRAQLGKLTDRVGDLEKTYVTRDDLDRHIQRLEASAVRMHEANSSTMARIEEKLDRGSNTRHDIRDSAHAVQTMTRQMLEESKQDRGVMRELISELKRMPR